MTTTQNPAQDVSDQLDLDITHALHRKGYPLIPVSTVRTVMRAARELQQAQVVGFDHQPETSRSTAAVAHMLADGWNWDLHAWVRPPQPSAPVVGDDARDAARYRWLRDVSAPPHNFHISVPIEFQDECYTSAQVDAAIDQDIESGLTGRAL